MARNKETQSADGLFENLRKEIARLEKREVDLKGSIAKLEKEKAGLMDRKNNLQNEIITKVQAAEKKIVEQTEHLVNLDREKRDALNQAKAKEAEVESLKNNLKADLKLCETRDANLRKGEAELANRNEMLKEKLGKLQEIKKLIEAIS